MLPLAPDRLVAKRQRLGVLEDEAGRDALFERPAGRCCEQPPPAR